jgi:hypothetical protein
MKKRFLFCTTVSSYLSIDEEIDNDEVVSANKYARLAITLGDLLNMAERINPRVKMEDVVDKLKQVIVNSYQAYCDAKDTNYYLWLDDLLIFHAKDGHIYDYSEEKDIDPELEETLSKTLSIIERDINKEDFAIIYDEVDILVILVSIMKKGIPIAIIPSDCL